MTGILVIGSNYGLRENALSRALDYLKLWGQISAKSDFYETPDMLGSGKIYLNAVVELQTSLEENELAVLLKEYETANGRDTEKRSRGDVPIDIDIVIWEGKVRRHKDFNAAYFKKGFNRIVIKELSV